MTEHLPSLEFKPQNHKKKKKSKTMLYKRNKDLQNLVVKMEFRVQSRDNLSNSAQKEERP
jgi:hypothetical protein